MVSDYACTEGGNECDNIDNAECNTTEKKCRCSLGYSESENTCVGNSGMYLFTLSKTVLKLVSCVPVFFCLSLR